MTDFDDVPGTSIDHILRRMRAKLINDLAAVLDVEAGLREAMIAAQHTSLVRDLREVLDIDAGLSAIVPTAPAPFRPEAETAASAASAGARHGNANAWGLWALELIDPLDDLAAGKVLRQYANAGTKADAEALARRLGRLPLALHLAGSYLAETTSTPSDAAPRITTFADYLAAINRAGQQAPRVTGDVGPGANASKGNEPGQAQGIIDRACELSLGLLASRGFPETRSLLQVLAYLADSDIPLLILDTGIIANSALFPGQDAGRQSRLIHSLAELGLVDIVEPPPGEEDDGATASSPVLRIHPMVRNSSRVRADLDVRAGEYLRLAAALLYKAADNADPEDPRTWPLWHALAPHCTSFLCAIAGHSSEPPSATVRQAALAALRAAQYQVAQGRAEQAAAECRQILRVLSQVPGVDTAVVLEVRQELACALRDQGQLEEAERELRAILQERMDLLSPEDQETVALLDRLARTGGQAHERPALLEREWDQGLAHPLLDVFETRHHLAITLAYRAWSPKDKDEYEAAARVQYQAVYEAQRRILGDRHPDTLESRQGLAIRLLNAGQAKEAEREFRAIYETGRRLPERGEQHPETLLTLSWIAAAAAGRGELAEAEAIYREAYREQMRILGGDHPQTLYCHDRLAHLLRSRGELTEAEAIYRDVHQAYRRIHGEHHQETLATLLRLAGVLSDRGELAEAEAVCRQVYQVRRQILGDDHPDTVAARYNLATVLEISGQLADAESEYGAVLDAERRTLGNDHPSTVTTRHALAGVLVERGRQWIAGASSERLEPEAPAPAASRPRAQKSHSQPQKEAPTVLDSPHNMVGSLHDPRRFATVSTEYREDFPDAEERAVAGSYSS